MALVVEISYSAVRGDLVLIVSRPSQETQDPALASRSIVLRPSTDIRLFDKTIISVCTSPDILSIATHQLHMTLPQNART